jgi:tRNA pseudouridine55 synthase
MTKSTSRLRVAAPTRDFPGLARSEEPFEGKMFGVLAINKPAGMTSRDVVNRVQPICRPAKVGHTGTLDPMATGVLLIAVGPATRLVEFSHALPKSYEADFLLGKHSDTLDVEGQVIEVAGVPIPSSQSITSETKKWIGKVAQIPPKYSAINVRGQRAYELARRGTAFDLPSRDVQIMSIELADYRYPLMSLHVRCGSGTYIRSLGHDIAVGVGTDAVMSRLVRTSIGCVQLKDCIELVDLRDRHGVLAHLRPARLLVSDLPAVVLRSKGCERIRNGIPITIDDFVHFDQSTSDRLVATNGDGQLVAILRRAGEGRYRSLRVFQKTKETSQPNISRMPQIPES